MLARWDSEGNFESIFKKNIVSSEAKGIFKDIDDLDLNSKTIAWDKWADSMVKTDKNLKAFLITEDEAYKTKDLATYTKYLNDHNKTLDTATLKTKAWAFAKNAALNIGFTLVMMGISKVIDSMVNSQENAIKKADEFIEKFEEQRNTLTSNKKTIDSISSDYEKLAKGVDSLGRNVSLNTDEYARYNDIVNQIADMFPHMVQGYTDEGNAIIKCKGDVEELTQAYKDQKDAAQDAIIVGSAEVFAGFKASTDKDPEYIWEESGLLQMKELVDKIVATGGDVEKIQDIINDLGGNSLVIGDVFDKIGLDKGWFDWNTLDAEYISENIKKFQSLFNTLNTEIDAQAAKIKPIMQAYLEQSDKFQLADEKVQDMVKQIVGQFDAEFYSQFDSETQMASWVEENVIDKLRGNKDLVNDFSVMFDLQTKFNKGDITVIEYQEKLTAFLSLIDTLPDETQKAIKLLFGITTNDDGTTSSDVDTMVANVKEKFKGKFEKEIGQLKLDELEILTNLDISPDGIKDWSEVETLIANAGKEANRMTVSLSELEGASDKIKTLSSAFKELSDDGYITTKTLGEIQTVTGLSGDEWENYKTKLLNAKSGSSEFNQIMSEMTYKVLDNAFASKDLTSITEDEVEAILRENGVINASAVAHDWLTRSKESLRIETALTKASTAEQVLALATEAMQAGITGNALNDLILNMGIFNNTNLDVSQKVAALQEMGYYANWAAQGLNNIDNVKKHSVNGKDYIASYDKNGKLLGIEQTKEINIPDVKVPKITIPNYSGAIGNSSKNSSKKDTSADDAKKKAEEERIKKENEAFKAGLETRKKVLERYKAALDLTDFGLDITEEGDFSTRADLLNNKMSQITSYGEAMRKEFDRVTKIIPKTGEQADALASHIQSLGGDIRENVKLLRETRVAMEKLKIDSVVSVGDYYLEDLTSVLDDIESRIDRLSNDNNDDYEYTNKILNMKALLPTRSGTKNVRNERRGADHDAIQAEQETQDAINDIIETQIRKNEKLREDERTAILNELQELRANTQIKLTEFQDDVSNSCDIVTARIDATDVQFPEPSIDFSKAEKQFDDFGKVTDRLSDKAADLADSLAQIAIACGETPPNPLPRYATGTPNGNAKTKNLGIAGENYKPEILVDKATGKTTYIDKPTVFDLSTTDVIGEKATNSIPKFAKGTINPNYDKRPFNKRLEEFEARVSDWLDAHSGVGYPFEQIYPISSPYGIRVHPVTGQIRMHTGVDFGAGLGTKILSTTFGTVETSSWYGGYGNCVIIRELNGNRWLYGHMVEPSHLRPGDRIRRGELVGYVGSTGVSTGPHLHLERMPANGGYTDPLPYLPYYEAGTPDGNAKARRFGIAGENFKPEILIDKATGKTTYIDKPTVFDLSTTDVIGEKATAGMSKFATGTPTTDETVRKIIKQVCDEYGVPYEVALAVLDRESGNVIKLTANPDGSSYSHTSWQLYDYGVWADVSKADKDFINKAAEQGESGENFYEAFAIATKYAISALAQHYKSTGSWQGALGKYNGSGTYGSYAKEVIKASNSAPFKEAAKALGDNTDAKEVIKASNSAPFKEAAKALGDNTDALETNTTAIETDNDKKLTPEEKAVQDIQSRVNEMMAEIDKEAAKVTAESIKIHSNESLSDDEKAIESFKVLYPAADTGRKVGTDAYRGLLSQFLAWWEAVQNDPDTFSQETFDAYVKGLEELEDTVLNFEDTLANSKENVLNIMENSLSDIDDYISEHNDDGDWSLVGDSEADAIRRKMDIIQKYRDEDILSEEKYQKLIKELRDDEVDAEFEHSSNWIDERNQKGDWALYGDSEYEAWQRVAKWLREKYPDELDKIHEADQNAIDAKYQHSQNWIDERNAYNDWALFDDTEVDAWERVVKWLHEDYPNDINKLKEAEKNLFEARKKELNDATTFGNSYLESQKTLLQAHYGVENAIAEARHEINKELATSKTMYEYLDEDSRELLFNQDDYNKLRRELNTIENKSLDLQSEYESKLKGATLETIESITSEYQMQYETLMKSYEIAKADLEIAKKKQKLNNVLAERNVRMFINGSWQWVANTKDVADAQSELADAKYAKQVEEAGLTQKQAIDDLTRQQNELSLVVKEFEGGVISLDEAVKKAGKAINYIPQAMMDMLNNAKVDTKAYSQGSSSRSANGVWYDSNYSLDSQQDNNSKSTSSSKSSGDPYEYNATATYPGLGLIDVKIENDRTVTSGLPVGTIVHTNDGDYIITGKDGDNYKSELYVKEKLANGTKRTAGGLTLMGEFDDELYISSHGRLIPITQPTIGNIPSGGAVFNSEQMKNIRTLWDMSNLNLNGIDFMGGVQHQQTSQTYDNRIIINGMTVDNGSADGQALISALQRYVGNH